MTDGNLFILRDQFMCCDNMSKIGFTAKELERCNLSRNAGNVFLQERSIQIKAWSQVGRGDRR